VDSSTAHSNRDINPLSVFKQAMKKHHLVLLPGLDGTGRLFGPLLNHLPPEVTATVVSYPHNKILSYEQLKPYVYQAFPPSEPFMLIAESFSGPLAVEVAATSPENLQALILCASFISNPAPPALQWIQNLNHPLWFRFQLPHAVVRYAGAMWDCEAAIIDCLIANLGIVSPAVLSHRLAQVMQVDVSAYLHRCSLPLLYLRATRDLLVMRRNWEAIARIKPDASYAEIDASHFVLQHKPAEALTAIQAFLTANFAE
jgi:pimeloyl-ACP methyl ester carboxylesterase